MNTFPLQLNPAPFVQHLPLPHPSKKKTKTNKPKKKQTHRKKERKEKIRKEKKEKTVMNTIISNGNFSCYRANNNEF
jgi:hypothetical protein